MQQPGQGRQRVGHRPTLLDVGGDVEQAVAADPVHLWVRPGKRPRPQLLLPRHAQLFRPPRVRTIPKPRQAFGVEAHHRVAQRLALPPDNPGRLRPARPLQGLRDRNRPQGRTLVRLALGKPPQLGCAHVIPDHQAACSHNFPSSVEPIRRESHFSYARDHIRVSRYDNGYKIFGFPTGVGCLIARRDALRHLRRPWFSGGAVQAVSVAADWHTMAEHAEAFEDGTLNFLNIPDVSVGIEWIQNIGLSTIQERTRCLTGWFLEQIRAMRHSNGSPLACLYGPRTTDARGGIISFNLLDDEGMIFDERTVLQEASAHKFSIRTGCFCNPGAGEAAFEIDKNLLCRTTSANFRTIDEHLLFLGLESGGAIRVSLRLVSTF